MGYNRHIKKMKSLIKILSCSVIVAMFASCGGGSIESQNDKHLKSLEKALEKGDIKKAGKEMQYFNNYDNNGGRFTKEQERQIEKMSEKYPESIRQAHHEKDRLDGKY